MSSDIPEVEEAVEVEEEAVEEAGEEAVVEEAVVEDVPPPPKRRGRPAGSKNKVKVAWSFPQSQNHSRSSHASRRSAHRGRQKLPPSQ